MSQHCRVRLTRLHKNLDRIDVGPGWMSLTPICQMKDLPLGGSIPGMRESFEPQCHVESVHGHSLEHVSTFTYLGSVFTFDGNEMTLLNHNF